MPVLGPPTRRSHDLTGDDSAAALPDVDEPLLGQHGQRALRGAQRQPVSLGHLTRRRELSASGELPGSDRIPDRRGDLLPGRPRSYLQRGKHGVLDERPPVAGQVAALAQPRVEAVEHRAADLPQLDRPQGRQDRPADVPLIGPPGGHVQLGDLHIPGHGLADRHTGIGPPPRSGLLEQLAQGDLSLPLVLTVLRRQSWRPVSGSLPPRPRRRRKSPGNGTPDRVAQGPARPAPGSPRQPRQAERPAHQDIQRAGRTI
jgi:hypothetical protein